MHQSLVVIRTRPVESTRRCLVVYTTRPVERGLLCLVDMVTWPVHTTRRCLVVITTRPVLGTLRCLLVYTTRPVERTRRCLVVVITRQRGSCLGSRAAKRTTRMQIIHQSLAVKWWAKETLRPIIKKHYSGHLIHLIQFRVEHNRNMFVGPCIRSRGKATFLFINCVR